MHAWPNAYVLNWVRGVSCCQTPLVVVYHPSEHPSLSHPASSVGRETGAPYTVDDWPVLPKSAGLAETYLMCTASFRLHHRSTT